MFFSTVWFLLIVICSVAGVVNALAVRRELRARREQGYACPGADSTGEHYPAGTVRKVPGTADGTKQKKAPFGKGESLAF